MVAVLYFNINVSWYFLKLVGQGAANYINKEDGPIRQTTIP